MAVMANLELKIVFNYFVIVKKHKVIFITLRRQFIGKIVLNYKATINN